MHCANPNRPAGRTRARVVPIRGVAEGDDGRDDPSLLQAFYAGDDEAFEALYDRYKNPIYGFITAILKSRSEAEDCLQEIFIKVARTRHGRRWEPTGSVRGWLYQIARRAALDRLDKQGRRAREVEGENVIASATDSSASDPVLKHALLRCIERLPDEQRAVFRARGYVGLTFREISDALEEKLGTVKSRYRLATEQLRACLEEATS